VSEVASFLEERLAHAVREGVAEARVWLDPGIGFGKTLEHNLALLDATPRLKALGHPVLVGASRKSFIGRIDRDGPADQRIGGSVAAALSAAARGVDGVRVHDLAETRQALAVWSAIEGTPLG
jgi:dihydropteroate synthase